MMSEKSKPNLFNFATSELSHDAFIAWLMSWSDPIYRDEPLYNFSKKVLEDFFVLAEKNLRGIKNVKVKTQYQNIDVLILVTDGSDTEWAVIIENKIHSREHSDQMNRYRNKIYEDNNHSDISKDQIIGIYYKMWEQSDMRKVRESNYSHFGRKHMIDLLKEEYQTGTNDIVDHYEKYIQGIQKDLNAYKTEPVSKWTGMQWTGFYSKLKEDLNDGDFGYVANKSGGFMGFWYGGEEIGGGDTLYIQSEEGKFCFKIHIKESKKRKMAKNFWHPTVIEAGKEIGLEVVKPRVMRTGQWFTIGVIKTPKDDPWMSIDDKGVINYQKTLQVAREALDVISTAARKKEEWENHESTHGK